MIYSIDWNSPAVKFPLIAAAILFLITSVVVVVLVAFAKSYQKLLVQKNSQITYLEQMMNELFNKRVEMLAAFDKKYKKIETPNVFADIKSKVEFKKETDRYIKLKGCENILMNNSTELAQIINQYNHAVDRYNGLIKNIFLVGYAKRNGFLKKEIFDESEKYNIEA